VDLLTKDFDEPILYAPARTGNNHNSLKIITAFTDCERISTHMIALSDGIKENRFVKDITVDIILGMTKSSLTHKKHKEICRLLKFLNRAQSMPHVRCRYIKNGTEVHSKMYIWGKSKENLYDTAWCGSLNYTINAFYKRREVLTRCDPQKAYLYYKELLEDTVDCNDKEAFECLKNVKNATPCDEPVFNDDIDYAHYDTALTPVDTIRVSLLVADGSGTGYGSGINWGIRKNGTKRNLNQAYIPYNKADKKPGFFPGRMHPNDTNCPIFRVITKDFGSFHMRLAQANEKALHSAENNAIIGEWIRKKLKIPSGGFVTKEMLEHYGKTFVTFRKYADGTYLLDF
jgi:HKD family nuclease